MGGINLKSLLYSDFDIDFDIDILDRKEEDK